MNPARKIILTIIYSVTAVFLAIALGMAIIIGFGQGIHGLYSKYLPEITGSLVRHPCLMLLAITVLLFIFLMAAGSWIDHTGKKECIIAAVLMTAFLIGIQMWVVFGLNIIQNTDSFEVQDQAMAIARGVMQSVDYEKSAYFRKYGNNDLYLILCIGMYRLCNALHIENWSKFFALFNTFCIDAGLFVSCHIVAVLKNRRTALRAYLLGVLNPLNYVFIHWTYTCTYSIPLMFLSVGLAVYIKRHKGCTVRKAVCFILIGLTAVVGYYLRPTAVFPVIALILVALLDLLPAKGHHARRAIAEIHDEQAPQILAKKSVRRKTALYRLVVLVLTLVVMGSAAKLIKTDASRYNTDTSYNFPIEHWLMVGITGDGRLTGEDMKYTSSFETKEEKQAADRAAIEEALEERGTLGTAVFLIGKIGVTWADGTDEYYTRTSQSENSQVVLYQLVSGAKRGALMLYCQAFRIIVLLLAVMGILREIIRKSYDSFFSVCVITVLGGLVFYMFWEGKPVYSLPFMQFLALIACDAWNPMSRAYYESVERSRFARRIERTAIVMIIALVLVVFGSDSEQILRGQTYTTWSIVCSSPAIKEYVRIKPGKTMEQDFSPAYNFNRIRLVGKKTSDRDCRYGITLSCGNEKLVYFEVKSSDIHKKKIVLSFDEIKPEKGKMYRITIQNLGKKGNSIAWGVRKCYISSQYAGERYLDGEPQVGDTLLDVYKKYIN